jgi:hypothetical protein
MSDIALVAGLTIVSIIIIVISTIKVIQHILHKRKVKAFKEKCKETGKIDVQELKKMPVMDVSFEDLQKETLEK